MNRVWKKFFRKLAEPVGIFFYVFGTMFLAEYVGDILGYGADGYITVIVVMIILPILAMMIRMTWRQAKDEVARENEVMLNTLKEK